MPLQRNPLRLVKPVTQKDKLAFYSSREWREIRRFVRDRDHNECVQCKKKGIVTIADVVHHKKEVEYFPELALTPENLESLCHACHELEHDKFPSMRAARRKRREMEEKFPQIW